MSQGQGEPTVLPKLKPPINGLPFPPFDAGNLNDVPVFFRSATRCGLSQVWREKAEPFFASAVGHPGWWGALLLVVVELMADDIFTRANDHNQRFWERGDTFEFIAPPGCATGVFQIQRCA